MKFRIQLLLLAICVLILSACSPASDLPDTSAQTDTAAALYETALLPIRNAGNLVLSSTWDLQRQVGSESFTESISGTASYSGLGSASMDAYVGQTIKIGTYEASYSEFYTGGSAYCQTGVDIYACDMTSKEFVDRQIPAVLLDPALYAEISAEATESRTLIRFSQATAMESWAVSADAVLLSATGTATLDPGGNLLQSAYHAQYQLGQITYTLKVTNKVTTPASLDLQDTLPAGVSAYPTLTTLDAPRQLLQAIGHIRTASAITCSYEEQLNCKAAGISRSQLVQVNTYGSADDFIARTDYSGSITNQAGDLTVTEQTELFLDGRKSVSINGSAAIEQPGYTAQQMRTYCESSVLSALFPVAYMKDARWEETGNIRTLHFTGTDALANALCANIYDSLQTGNLESFSESHTTGDISG